MQLVVSIFLLLFIVQFSFINQYVLGQAPNFSDATPFDLTDDMFETSMNQVFDAVNSSTIDSEYISGEINKSISTNNIRIQQYIDVKIASIMANLTSYIDSKMANISQSLEKLNATVNNQKESTALQSRNESNIPVTLTGLERLDTTNTLLTIFVVLILLFAGFSVFLILKILRKKDNW